MFLLTYISIIITFFWQLPDAPKHYQNQVWRNLHSDTQTKKLAVTYFQEMLIILQIYFRKLLKNTQFIYIFYRATKQWRISSAWHHTPFFIAHQNTEDSQHNYQQVQINLNRLLATAYIGKRKHNDLLRKSGVVNAATWKKNLWRLLMLGFIHFR